MKVVVFNNISLDGVMQAPARPDEDTRGGFRHGGWGALNMDAEMGRDAMESASNRGGGGLLLGRRTYQDFFAVWPKAKDNPFTEVMNKAQKYVASNTLKEPLPWENSTLLKGDAGEAVARLKAGTPDGQLVILGSGELIRSLLPRKLIDEFVLLIHPLILGSGRRLFPDEGAMARLRLANSRTTRTGVIIATYQTEPAGKTIA